MLISSSSSEMVSQNEEEKSGQVKNIGSWFLCLVDIPKVSYGRCLGLVTLPSAVNRTATSAIMVPLMIDSSTTKSVELEQPWWKERNMDQMLRMAMTRYRIM